MWTRVKAESGRRSGVVGERRGKPVENRGIVEGVKGGFREKSQAKGPWCEFKGDQKMASGCAMLQGDSGMSHSVRGDVAGNFDCRM